MLDSIGTRPRKPDRHHRSDGEKAKSKTSSSSSSHKNGGATASHLSFLFVVNELVIDSEVMEQMASNGLKSSDDWCNRIPPRNPGGYCEEIKSRVLRYENGEVMEAQNYHWFRAESSEGRSWNLGSLYAYDDNSMPLYDSNGNPCCAAKYKTFTIFSCNPLLPVVVVDGDLTTDGSLQQYPLLFFHPPSKPGVSQAATLESTTERGPGLVKFAAGASPSWIPSLVPPTYSNPYGKAPGSTGLAGELPIVLGLMAFSEAGDLASRTNRTNEIFLGANGHRGRWRDGKWHHHAPPRGYPLSMDEDPRGFVVVVFLDPENPLGSTKELIQHMEWHGAIVQESTSSHRRT